MASQAVFNDAYVEEYISRKTSCMRVCQALNKTVHVDCFEVFIIILVTVIFTNTPKQNIFNFLSVINIFNKLLIFAWHYIAFFC